MAIEFKIEKVCRLRLEAQFKALLEEVCIAHNKITPNNDEGLKKLKKNLETFAKFSRPFFYAFDDKILWYQFKALENIQYEWLTLYPLIEQRQPNLTQHLAKYAQITDDIANDCIRQGAVPLNPASRDCLTVFEKTRDIHRYYTASPFYKPAYSRFSTLSVPRTHWNQPWLWMGLSHETGHHLWDHHQISAKIDSLLALLSSFTVSSLLTPGEPAKLAQQWLEEICADIYAILILGPAYVRSFVVWQSSRIAPEAEAKAADERALFDDHDHPPPLVRGAIQIKTLEELQKIAGTNADFEASEIKTVWQTYMATLSPTGTYKFWIEQAIEDVLVDNLIKFTDKLVEAIVKFIRTDPTMSGITFYSKTVHQEVEKIYTDIGNNTMPGSLTIPKALILSATWYAWERVATSSQMNDQGRTDRLNKIRKWVNDQTIKDASLTAPGCANASWLAKPTTADIDQFLQGFQTILGVTDRNNVFEPLLKDPLSELEEFGCGGGGWRGRR